MPSEGARAPSYDVLVATSSDIPDIVALQEVNLARNGGSLSVAVARRSGWLCASIRMTR